MNDKDIERKATKVIKEVGVPWQPPISVDIVARKHGLQVVAAQLGDDVSGVLVIEGKKGTIGYNVNDAEVRQRFTIAHELGHFLLDVREADTAQEKTLYIDKTYPIVYHRDQRSASGEHSSEVRANKFAAALLMPTELVRAEIDTNKFDLADEQSLTVLARKFNVSTQAMAFRLAKLGLLDLD